MAIKDLAPEELVQARVRAVELRLAGHTLAETAAATGLSAPTIIKAVKRFRAGGWAALAARPRGRKAGQGGRLNAEQLQRLLQRLQTPPRHGLWNRSRVALWGRESLGVELSERAVDRLLADQGLGCPSLQLSAPPKGSPFVRWYRQQWQPLLDWADRTDARRVLGWCRAVSLGYQICFQIGARKRHWLVSTDWPSEAWLQQALERLQADEESSLLLCLKGVDLSRADEFKRWLRSQEAVLRLACLPANMELSSH